VASLAAATGAPQDALARLLRALASVGLFTETEDGRYGLTAAGEWLRSEDPSLRDLAIALAGPGHWRSLEHVGLTVTTGQPAAPHALGASIWEYYADHPDEAAAFARAMGQISSVVGDEIVRTCELSRFDTIVDVGGSQGVLLARLLREAPSARGVLFDRADVVSGAGPVLAGRGVAGRVEIVAGDFFESVPAGGDLYLLKHILHDWDDERALRILHTCAAAAPPGSTLLVVERLLGSGADANAYVADLLMFVMFGGRERTEAEYEALLAAAGYRLERVTRLSMFGLLEARRLS
jgi:hypothetical protein